MFIDRSFKELNFFGIINKCIQLKVKCIEVQGKFNQVSGRREVPQR
jgi:hypothetical protein